MSRPVLDDLQPPQSSGRYKVLELQATETCLVYDPAGIMRKMMPDIIMMMIMTMRNMMMKIIMIAIMTMIMMIVLILLMKTLCDSLYWQSSNRRESPCMDFSQQPLPDHRRKLHGPGEEDHWVARMEIITTRLNTNRLNKLNFAPTATFLHPAPYFLYDST